MIGQTVSHYKILEKLGEGGMGVVYKAHDMKLDRTVALKFLPSHLSASEADKARFIQEAKAASALNHPNVCVIYSIEEAAGNQFIAMEYVDGTTMRERILHRGEVGSSLQLNEALAYAIQIGEALHEAHSKGIVHRDIKSENIMVNSKNQIKVMDFGLAKLKGSIRLTKTSSTVGTLAYMSPEQIQGMKIDHRADLWSFGVVMYEMITGELPFKADHDAALMYTIINVDAPELQEKDKRVIPGISELVRGLLEKDRERRVSSADEVVRRLRSVVRDSSQLAHKADDRKSIAVLPFANLSPDPNNEYFSDGITEELISVLSKVTQLKVCSRSLALQYKGKLIDPRKVGPELSVQVILEGSIRRIGQRVRIAAALTNVVDGFQIWAESFDRQVDDVFAVQDEIARTIVDALQLQLSVREQSVLLQRYTANIEAYEEYLRGRYQWNKRTKQGFELALRHFENAIQFDKNYALAYTGVTDTYNALSGYAWREPKQSMQKAEEAARIAYALDPKLAEVQTSYALIHNTKFDFITAEKHYTQAIQLNPGYATAHQWLACLYLAQARFEPAVQEMERAQRLEPLSLVINAYSGFMYFCMGEHQRAIKETKKAIDADNGFAQALHFSGWALAWAGRFDEALDALKNAEGVWGEQNHLLVAKTAVLARCGNKQGARETFQRLIQIKQTGVFVHDYDVGCAYAALGDYELALESIEKAAETRSYWWLTLLMVHPVLEPLRGEFRFQSILKNLQLIA